MTARTEKWGGAACIQLPEAILDEVSMQEHDPIELVVEDNRIVIRKAGRRKRAGKSLEERFKDYGGDYRPEEYDWGKPMGKEVW